MARVYRTDPVCGELVEIRTDAWSLAFQDSDYYFCSGTCMTVFEAFPATYADPGGRARPQQRALGAEVDRCEPVHEDK